MAVNDKITKADYNNIRTKVAGILGTGTGNSGYGQTVRSTAVDEDTRVTVREWGNLYYDIVNCYIHQTGTLPPAITQVTANETVKTDVDATVISAAISGTTLTVYSVTSGMVAVGQTITGTGVSPGTIITDAAPQTSIAISSYVSAIVQVDDLTYDVTFNIPLQPVALQSGGSFTIAGNSNSSFNGTFVAKTTTTTSITLVYGSNPGVYGTGTTTITPAISTNPWGRSNWTVNNSQSVSIRTLAAESSTIYPYTQYDSFANTVITNKFNVDSTQAAVVPKGTKSITYPNATYGSFWNTELNCVTTVQFTTADKARHFFNSGGEIRFVSQLDGSTSNAQTIEWTNLLSTAGTKRFGGNRPGTGTTPMDGLNFYRLTNTYQTWSTVSGSSPYTSNIWTIKAKCDVADNSSGTATQIDFLLEWVDGYVDPFPTSPAPGDEVYGTVSIAVSTYEATGTLQPSGSGLFAVESPTVTVADLSPDPIANYLLAPAATTKLEGESITFTVSGTGIPDGTYSYEIVGSGVIGSDFVDNTLTGSVAVAGNSGSFTKTLKLDYVTDGTETFYARLKNGPITLATSGTITVNDTTTALIDYLIVGGGGGGGTEGGGGAGGVLSGVYSFTPGQVYTITVGQGGTPGGLGGGNQGTKSEISGTGIVTKTSQGGGAGATATRSGYDGGSGGGGAGVSQGGGSGTPGQGYNGGGTGGGGGGGGGGGAGSVGLSGPAGRGGDGTPNTITGSTVGVLVSGTYYVSAGAGGSPGGTNGVGFGSPGSGASPGGTGTNGTVILRIPTANYTGIKTGTSTVTVSGSYTIVQWTGSGSYTA